LQGGPGDKKRISNNEQGTPNIERKPPLRHSLFNIRYSIFYHPPPGRRRQRGETMTPIIILAFANDKDAYLQMIVKESKSIYNTLLNHNDKGFIKLYREENTSITDIFNYFYRYNDEIFIFHYGGHASGTHLQLETMKGGSQMADARGLAQLMGRQKELRLVFLNGCATRRQVALLHDAGVRAVIATSVPIDDKSATEFSEHFYKSLANRFTIKEAFNNARNFMVTTYGTTRQIKEYKYRDVNWAGMKKNGKKEMAWGLYVHEDHEKVLDWKLPTSIAGPSPFPKPRQFDPINIKLVELLLNESALYNDDLNYWKQKFEKDKDKYYRQIRREVPDNFPTPIGGHLKTLFQDSSRIDLDRLKQFVTTYQTIIELLCFTMLSELWDAKFKDPDILIDKDYLTQFEDFFDLRADSYQSFPYIKLIETVSRIFNENKIEYFVQELKTVEKNFIDKDDFYYALLFMENMKKKIIEDNIEENEIEDFCHQTEEHFGIILKQLTAFFIKYKLTTIKHIEIIKYKHKDAKYIHERIMLDRFSEGTLDEKALWDSYTDSNSVILLKNAEDISEYMNLSPFLVDKTAIFPDWEKSQIYFFSYKDKLDNHYYYRFSGKEEYDPLTLTEQGYPQIRDQFTEFKKNIFNLSSKDESTMGERHGKI
jgi:hypothetical protein